MLDMAVAEEAPSISAVKKPSTKELREEEILAGMEQTRGGDQQG
jgi:hypothetical protein